MIMPKNVMCKKCNNLINGWCEKKIDSPDPDMVRDCQYFWEKTNADRIRAMSDEELAEFLCGVYDEDEDAAKFINGFYIPCYDQHSIKEWLKQPAE
jgi:hypothetical protein